MMTALREWFGALSQREKIMVSVLGVLVALTIAWYGIYQPLSSASTDAALRYQQAVERQARIESKVAALQLPAAAQSDVPAGPIDAFVSRRAGEAGFAVGRIDPQSGGSVDIVIDSAKPVALFGWLSELEGQGLAVQKLSVNPSGGGTVTANISLQSRNSAGDGN
ncbi:type II secretion system protein M [Parasphingorhabdus sp.]|uniref:type II secretion system protein M n=1 Tax=Parasphingorhabdus sp. TaxID=2709688 RepID=UPI003265F3B0